MDNTTQPTTAKNCTTFYGGQTGAWRVLSFNTLCGSPLLWVSHIEKSEAAPIPGANGYIWQLQGVASYLRYTTRPEKNMLDEKPSVLGRTEASYAAMISLKKSDEWWQLTQDERRNIFEQQSQHIRYSTRYLPAIARKLYHCRDLGGEFDFITWFEFAPDQSGQFDELVDYLRHTEEWKYVVREVDVRLVREEG